MNAASASAVKMVFMYGLLFLASPRPAPIDCCDAAEVGHAHGSHAEHIGMIYIYAAIWAAHEAVYIAPQ
jgi:hypothetical protein